MSQSYYRRRPDRRFGIVLVAVFTLGILGASLTTIINGGELPQAAAAPVHLTKASAPLCGNRPANPGSRVFTRAPE